MTGSLIRWGKYFGFYLPEIYFFSAIFNNISARSFICLPHSWFTSLQKKQYEPTFSWHPCFFSTQLFWPWKSCVPCNSSKCLNSWNIPTFVNGKRLSPNFLLETCSMPDCKAKVLNQKIFLFKISECCPFFSVLWADWFCLGFDASCLASGCFVGSSFRGPCLWSESFYPAHDLFAPAIARYFSLLIRPRAKYQSRMVLNLQNLFLWPQRSTCWRAERENFKE